MKRFAMYMAMIVLLPGVTTAGLAYAASGSKKAPAAAEVKAENPADFVGSDVCATCHAEVAKKFESNPHSKLALTHGGQGATCESCHGGGKAHVEGGGDVTKIKQISKLSVKQVDETCLGCHAGAHPNFERSPHAKGGVGCTGCHSVHAGNTEEKLLKASQPKLCYQCHTDVKPQFSMPFHHKVNEGLVKCTDCHDAHGTFNANNVRSTADQNMICTKCHAETRGPWVFEHAVVKGEGCTGCHTPHGSQNPRLLNVANINQLCNQCHSPVAADTVHGMSAGSADRPVCITCHTMIHGSNVNPAFIR
jgi:DmsE family decaheme c-type cytochrome